MSDWRNPDDEEVDDFDEGFGYFAQELEEADPTDKSPRFFRIDSMSIVGADLEQKRVDELVQMYIGARNQLAADRKGYKAREAAVKAHMMAISYQLMQKGDAIGTDSFKTPFGTAFRKVKESFRVGSWDDLVAWVKQTGNFSVLQKRVSPLAAKEVRDTDQALPPGIDCVTEVSFAVRSPTARKV